MDVRNLITVEIEKLAEKLETGWDEDGDDETHGGKRNGKGEEEAPSEEKEAEVSEENQKAEELVDKVETKKDSEEKEELPIEEASQEEAKEETAEKNETAEPQQEEAEITVTEDNKEIAQRNDQEPKEENNVSDIESEPNTDKKEEAKAYNDAVDSPPLYEETGHDHSSEKTSFIDEMIMDNMTALVVGNVVAFIVAMLAIKFFISFVTKYGFKAFGWYRIIVGGVILAMLLTGHNLTIV
jgi:Fe2+ transport system protein B